MRLCGFQDCLFLWRFFSIWLAQNCIILWRFSGLNKTPFLNFSHLDLQVSCKGKIMSRKICFLTNSFPVFPQILIHPLCWWLIAHCPYILGRGQPYFWCSKIGTYIVSWQILLDWFDFQTRFRIICVMGVICFYLN